MEDFIFGKDNLSWMSGSALSEAGLLADYMILRTGMTALGKVYYRTQQDVMLHVSVTCRQSFFGSMVYSEPSIELIQAVLMTGKRISGVFVTGSDIYFLQLQRVLRQSLLSLHILNMFTSNLRPLNKEIL